MLSNKNPLCIQPGIDANRMHTFGKFFCKSICFFKLHHLFTHLFQRIFQEQIKEALLLKLDLDQVEVAFFSLVMVEEDKGIACLTRLYYSGLLGNLLLCRLGSRGLFVIK